MAFSPATPDPPRSMGMIPIFLVSNCLMFVKQYLFVSTCPYFKTKSDACNKKTKFYVETKHEYFYFGLGGSNVRLDEPNMSEAWI